MKLTKAGIDGKTLIQSSENNCQIADPSLLDDTLFTDDTENGIQQLWINILTSPVFEKAEDEEHRRRRIAADVAKFRAFIRKNVTSATEVTKFDLPKTLLPPQLCELCSEIHSPLNWCNEAEEASAKSDTSVSQEAEEEEGDSKFWCSFESPTTKPSIILCGGDHGTTLIIGILSDTEVLLLIDGRCIGYYDNGVQYLRTDEFKKYRLFEGGFIAICGGLQRCKKMLSYLDKKIKAKKETYSYAIIKKLLNEYLTKFPMEEEQKSKFGGNVYVGCWIPEEKKFKVFAVRDFTPKGTEELSGPICGPICGAGTGFDSALSYIKKSKCVIDVDSLSPVT